MSGWFAVKRGTLEHDLFAPEGKWSKYEAWTWMIENACFKPTVIDLGGSPHTVPRGALCYSLRFLADKFKWSVKAVRTFLKRLQSHAAIEILAVQSGSKRGTARTQITLCNYDKYQSAGHSKGTAGAQQGHKEEQGNNIPVGADEKSSAVSPSDFLWKAGVKFLTGSGVSEKQARSLIGKWKRDAGEGQVISALGRAQREGAIEPVSFIEGCLKFDRKKSSAPQEGEQREFSGGIVKEFNGGQWLRVHA